MRVFLVVAVCVSMSAGCGSGSPGTAGSPSGTPTASSTATPSRPTPTPTALQLDAEKAADALAGPAVPAEFRADIRCPSRSAKNKQLCSQPTNADTAWSASLTYLGKELPKANGLQATVVMNVVTAKSERSAVGLYRRQAAALRPRNGSYKIPITRGADGYTPGQQGRGTVTAHKVGDWQGVELSDRYVLVFDDSRSGAVTSGTSVLRRGVHVLTVSWGTGDAQARSKLARLSDRVAAALDQAGRS